ncbi:hypothetical protein MFUR16E_13285 [Methylobacterium fujisawaense]
MHPNVLRQALRAPERRAGRLPGARGLPPRSPRATGCGLALAIAAMASRRSGPSLRLRNRPDRSGLAVEILRG